MKQRFWVFVTLFVFVAVIVIAASAASSNPHSSSVPGLITCTVNGAAGVDRVTITNQNTGKTIIKTIDNLPYTFNLTVGDTLQFDIILTDGYSWNAWEINQSPWFAQDNPFTMKTINNLVLNPQCLVW